MTSSPPQQYCLRWNNYQNNLTNVFDQLLQSEAFVDVTLACEGHSLKAHKVVLSATSPYFQSLFFDNPCKHPIVILNGIKWDELKSVVEFMYRGEINVSQEQLAPLLKVAEVLKIRGLADVSRVGPSASTRNITPIGEKTKNLGDFNSPNHDSGSESPSASHLGASNGHTGNGVHPNLHPLVGVSTGTSGVAALSPAQAHQMLASLSRRKRRKMSTPERTPSPSDDLDDQSNQLEIDSTNGDYDHSPGILDPASNLASISMSLNPTPSNTPNLGRSGGGSHSLRSLGGSPSGSSLGPLGPALLNLHAAAAAAAVANSANSHQGQSTSGGGGNPNSSSLGGSSSVSNDLDIKPGIVEMIREEERAKMLESAHGWLGPNNSTLSDSYQYQIQNLWQKCWNQNQTGMMHALRFRERGPLKSWRPETMAEAIFAVLREGLSLSQAARKYDIPYPTFVLYANRVHNMLGPSADGSSNTDLMSDMRPKGRGRPQRILLGTWPEEHIRGVIRAVVFRDTQTKDDMPAFVFNRDGGLCLSQTGGNNGLDMSLHQQFISNPSGSPFMGTPPPASGQSSSQGQSSSSTAAASPGPGSSQRESSTCAGINLINLPESSSNSDRGTGANQHLQIQMSHGNSASSSASSSPLQQALNNSNALSGIGAQAQSQLLALQQRHLQQQLQLHQQSQQRRTSSSSSDTSLSRLGLLNSSSSTSGSRNYLHRSGNRISLLGKDLSLTEKDLPQIIKTEVVAPYDDEDEDEEEMGVDEELIGSGGTIVVPMIQEDDIESGEMDEDLSRIIGHSEAPTGNNLVKNLSFSSVGGGKSLEEEHQSKKNKSTNNNNNNNKNNDSCIVEDGGNSIDDRSLSFGTTSTSIATAGQQSNQREVISSSVIQSTGEALLSVGRGGKTPSPKSLLVESQTTSSS